MTIKSQLLLFKQCPYTYYFYHFLHSKIHILGLQKVIIFGNPQHKKDSKHLYGIDMKCYS